MKNILIIFLFFTEVSFSQNVDTLKAANVVVIGATGLKGDTGPTGLTGAMGPIGLTGPTGAIGATGATGLTGLVGPIGLRGPTGATGLTGSIGPAGPPAPAQKGTVIVLGNGLYNPFPLASLDTQHIALIPTNVLFQAQATQIAAAGQKVFTFLNVPVNSDNFEIFRNGVYLSLLHFSYSGNNITIPDAVQGDEIEYRHLR